MSKSIVQGVPNVATLLNRTLPEKLKASLVERVAEESRVIARIIELNAPMKTGALRSDIKIKKSKKGLSARIGVFSAARGFIARILVSGAKPHPIEPTKRRALAFLGRFAATVKHPGARANDFMFRTTSTERTNFQKRLRQAIVAALKEVSR